ncbi:MAG: hypothetical protein BEN19_01410 [Epulopiscium sp. Nuni2H_MBin003]|nr:MAG: hypothetical protein BEN19_01410 [Epulopiscium sp. Nuni2H_MBin003]
MIIPNEVIFIINELEKHNFEAYMVGGCVRDMIMNRIPNDWDITTNATPKDMKKIFLRTYDTGISHGTLTVIVNEQHFEVTTYRVENEYIDFRRPANVAFVDDITLDLSRRDFTINAIAYHPIRKFIDPYDGIYDIKNHKIRSVRNANERFSEDALRILRAIRFSAQLDFDIDANTIYGIQNKKYLLAHISKERIRDEFNKIMLSSNVGIILKMNELGLLNFVAEKIELIITTHSEIINIIQSMPAKIIPRYLALLHALIRIEKADSLENNYFFASKVAKKVLQSLKFDNYTIKQIEITIRYFFDDLNIDDIQIKKLLRDIGVDNFDYILQIKRHTSSSKLLEEIIYKKERIINNNECYTLKNLAITGKDISQFAMGKQIGDDLEKALEYVMKHPDKNDVTTLLKYLYG